MVEVKAKEAKTKPVTIDEESFLCIGCLSIRSFDGGNSARWPSERSVP